MQWINSSRVSLAMSATALFVALGGTAVAVTQVGTSQLRGNAVTAAKIKNGAVTTAKIKNGAVINSKLGTGAVGTGKLANGAVSSSKIAAGAVGSSQIAAGSVGSAQLVNGAVGTTKLGAAAVATGNLADSAVTTTKLADNAVTSAKVADGSLTASDVAPNTFLAAGGTAVNSSALGGLSASAFLTGGGRMVTGRLALSAGQGPITLLELDFGHIDATCVAGSIPKVTFVAELPVDNVIASATISGAATTVDFRNSLAGGGSLPETGSGGAAQSVTWQAAYNDGTKEQLATAWTTSQNISGGCVFTGQGLTSL